MTSIVVTADMWTCADAAIMQLQMLVVWPREFALHSGIAKTFPQCIPPPGLEPGPFGQVQWHCKCCSHDQGCSHCIQEIAKTCPNCNKKWNRYKQYSEIGGARKLHTWYGKSRFKTKLGRLQVTLPNEKDAVARNDPELSAGSYQGSCIWFFCKW